MIFTAKFFCMNKLRVRQDIDLKSAYIAVFKTIKRLPKKSVR